jgi:alanine racemase
MGWMTDLIVDRTSWLSVDLAALVANWRLLNQRSAPGRAAAVVKADGYGLGAIPIACALAAAGCTDFFVAHPSEAAELRLYVPPRATVYVLNGATPGDERALADIDVVPLINDLGGLARWAATARTLDRRLPVAIHIDTGMNRLGLDAAETMRLAAEPERLAGLDLRLWVSHLACADIAEHPLTANQTQRFRAACASLPPAPTSLANSSGIFRLEQSHGQTLTRPGAALYGVNPTPEATNPMRSVVTLRARILQVRCVDSGQTVGYGATHSFTEPAKIAVIAAGYADGFHRSLSGRAIVHVGGHACPVVGRISMDLSCVDISTCPAPVTAGDFVTLLGAEQGVDALATQAGTIGYEILTSLGRRYERRYVDIIPPSEGADSFMAGES